MRRATLLLLVPLFLTSPLVSAAPCAGFGDVEDTDTYCQAVAYVKSKGITVGCGSTGANYCPNDFVTRAQMALFLQREGKGGANNVIGNFTSTIGGGTFNTSTGNYSVVAGGSGNSVIGSQATVSGGLSNSASALGSTVSGGNQNTASGEYSMVLGGRANVASGIMSAAGGNRAKADTDGSFIWADSREFDFSGSVNDFFGVRATGGVGFTVTINSATGALPSSAICFQAHQAGNARAIATPRTTSCRQTMRMCCNA